jgi:YfiR/HmsC-like
MVRGQTRIDEYRLKAVFLHRFAEFVEWPPAVWSNRGDVEICVLAPSPFDRALSEMIGSESLRGRPVVIREIGARDAVDSCHLLFVSGPADHWTGVLRRVAGRPVLTVSDADSFLDEGGIIQLRTVSNRVRFDVSVPAAERARLRLSSQLLRLALTVRGGPS